jgi:iron complex outermembrane receptor protein
MQPFTGPTGWRPHTPHARRLLLSTAVLVALGSWSLGVRPAQAADADSASRATVGELVVTAERRQENLVDVPVSVAVVTGQKLTSANYTDLTDLQYVAPSVTYNSNFGGGFEIRGVGTQSVTASIEQSVGIVVDDVVYGLPEISFAGPSYQALTDIDRIEILRGPQGTLFGKNSSAGVLQIVTKKPSLGVTAADASFSYGTGNEIKATLNLNAPIGQTAAFRLSAFDYRRDGFVHNLYTHKDVSGYDNLGVRGKFLWKPNDRTEVYLIGSYVKDEDNGNGIWTLRSCGSGFKGGLGVFSACATDAPYGVVPGPKNLSGAWDGALGVNQNATDLSANLSYDLGFGTLRSITAWQHIRIKEDVEVDSSPLPILSVNHNEFDEKEFTQEFRLDGKLGRFDYTGGVFYYDTTVLYPGTQAGTYNYLPANSPILLTSGVGGPTPCCTSVDNSYTKSEAAYGQVTYHATDQLLVTGGLRYTHDQNKLENYAIAAPGICQFAYAFGSSCLPASGLPSTPLWATISASNLSGKVTVQYYLTPHVNAYVTYATGYKGPSISYPRGLPLVGVHAETSQDIEAGVKGTFFDGRLYVAVDGFYTKYKNFQGQSLYTDPSNPANRGYVTTNAGGLLTDGAEAEATWQATPELTLNAAVAYQHTEFTSFAIPCNDGFTNPATTPGQCTFANPAFPGVLQFNAAGYPLPYAPEYIFSLGFNWVHPIADNYEVALSGNYHWQSTNYTVVADPNTIVPAYGLLGMNLGFGPHEGSWRVSVFARNLLDQYFVTGIFKTPLDTGSAHSTPLSTIGYSNIPSIESRRSVGVKVEVKF